MLAAESALTDPKQPKRMPSKQRQGASKKGLLLLVVLLGVGVLVCWFTKRTPVNIGKHDPARLLNQRLVNIAKVRAFLTAF